MSSPDPSAAAQPPSVFDDVIAWAEQFRPGDPVDQKVRLLLLDSIGCIAAGLQNDTVRQAAERLALAYPGTVHLPGSAIGLAPGGAAQLAAMALCWDEACEGLARAHGRPGVAVVPACLGLGARTGLPDGSLGSLLRAIVVGYEVGGRAGQLWRIRPGMHVDGSWHSLGAAVSAARLLGADHGAQAHAAQIAACQVPFSLYRPITVGSLARNTYPAHAAALGVLAGSAAAAGIAAPEDALAEGRRLALGHEPPGERDAAGHWMILEGYLKPFAAVRHVHYGAAAAIAMRERLGGNTRSIRGITLTIYEEAIRYCANRNPQAPIQAQFSLSYGLAAALVLGDLGPAAYGPAMHDPEIRRLERLVRIEPCRDRTARGVRGATLHVETDVCVATESADSVAGDPDRPLSRDETVAKFERYAGAPLGPDRARALCAAILTADWSTPFPPMLDA